MPENSKNAGMDLVRKTTRLHEKSGDAAGDGRPMGPAPAGTIRILLEWRQF